MGFLPDFRLETYFSRWEFTARYHLTASDAESMPMQELLARVGIKTRDRILERNRGIIAANLPLFAESFARYPELFE